MNPKDIAGLKKAPLRLFPGAAMIEGSIVLELGARKYGAYNWRDNPVRRTVYIEAAMRHLLAALDGEDSDAQSGRPHEAHALACMTILLDALHHGNLIDDRPAKGPAGALIASLEAEALNRQSSPSSSSS